MLARRGTPRLRGEDHGPDGHPVGAVHHDVGRARGHGADRAETGFGSWAHSFMAEHPAEPDIPAPDQQPPDEAIPQLVRGEVRDFLRAHEQRRRQLPRAIAARARQPASSPSPSRASSRRRTLCATELIAARAPLSGLGNRDPGRSSARLGAGVAVWLVRTFAPEASGSGIPHLKAVLHHLCDHAGAAHPRRQVRRRRRRHRQRAWRSGREGPTIQMGGALGQIVSGWFSLHRAGAAARSSRRAPAPGSRPRSTRRSPGWSSCSRRCSATSRRPCSRRRSSPP